MNIIFSWVITSIISVIKLDTEHMYLLSINEPHILNLSIKPINQVAIDQSFLYLSSFLGRLNSRGYDLNRIRVILQSNWNLWRLFLSLFIWICETPCRIYSAFSLLIFWQHHWNSFLNKNTGVGEIIFCWTSNTNS